MVKMHTRTRTCTHNCIAIVCPLYIRNRVRAVHFCHWQPPTHLNLNHPYILPNTNTQVHTHTHTRTHARTHTHKHTHIHTRMHARTHVSTFAPTGGHRAATRSSFLHHCVCAAAAAAPRDQHSHLKRSPQSLPLSSPPQQQPFCAWGRKRCRSGHACKQSAFHFTWLCL